MNSQTPKRKILIFIDWFLPGYKAGGPVRSMANMVEYLKEDYTFYIVTRNTDYTELTPYTTVESNCWEDFAENVKVYYADETHQNKATFKKLINEIQPDIAYINGVYSWKFSILPLIVARKSRLKKVIVAARGMLAQSAIDVKGGKKRLFLKAAKMAGLYKHATFHATNEKEQRDITRALGKGLTIQVADNLPKKNLPNLKRITKEKGQLKLVSLARIAPEKNTLFALEKLAELASFKNSITAPQSTSIQQAQGIVIREQLMNPDWQITFDLFGQIYNKDYWQQCQAVIEKLPENIKVEYRGTVDAELVGTTIQNYHALFMPTRGENFGHVILESFSAGRPVLISDQTPWRGLVSENAGWDVSLKTEEEKIEKSGERREVRGKSEVRSSESEGGEWCDVISTLVEMEQEEFDAWCDGARKRAEEFVNNPKLKVQYDSLFR